MAVSITASVGLGGINRPDDVRAIQQAFNDLPEGAGRPDPLLVVDGDSGRLTKAAILDFQTTNIGLAKDAKVDPGGSTLRMINARLDNAVMSHDPKALALASTLISNQWARIGLTGVSEASIAGGNRVALETHFHLDRDPTNEALYLATIRGNFEKVIAVFQRAASVYRARNDAEAASDQGVDPNNGQPFPAYTFHAHSINFTRSFAPRVNDTGFGPMCLAAMVLHEPVHFVDPQATVANDFYEHGAQYATILPNQAVHNPSSYVCYAQHLAFGQDVRFGAGKPGQ